MQLDLHESNEAMLWSLNTDGSGRIVTSFFDGFMGMHRITLGYPNEVSAASWGCSDQA